jgi:hypothetical protein
MSLGNYSCAISLFSGINPLIETGVSGSQGVQDAEQVSTVTG